MAYNTNDEIVAAFDVREIEQVCSIGNGVLDEARLTREKLAAFNLINSHLGTKYTLPLSVVVPVLKDCEADIARYNLYDDAPTSHIVDRFNYWTNWLVDVTRGKITLFDENGAKVGLVSNASGGSGFVTVDTSTKSFTDLVLAKGDLTC